MKPAAFPLLIAVFVLAQCRPAPALTPFPAAAPNTQLVHLRADTPIPTQTYPPVFITWTPAASPVINVPLPSEVPATSTPLSPVPTWTPPATWTPPPTAAGEPLSSHFLLGWPIANISVSALSRVYAYGSTYNGRLQVHHGVDLVYPLGTPLSAAAAGTVVYAGNDFVARFGPDNNYYGYLVIIQHAFLSPEGQPVFTLYGHMQDVLVQAGQVLREGDMIGTVGQSGVARGPHVHLEVRVGDPFDFGATRNPELWLRLLPNYGLLAGRVVDANGIPVHGAALSVQSSGGISRSAYSYADDSINADPVLGENFTLGDLPPDYYSVSARVNGQERFAQAVYIQPNQMTWMDIVLSR